MYLKVHILKVYYEFQCVNVPFILAYVFNLLLMNDSHI